MDQVTRPQFSCVINRKKQLLRQQHEQFAYSECCEAVDNASYLKAKFFGDSINHRRLADDNASYLKAKFFGDSINHRRLADAMRTTESDCSTQTVVITITLDTAE